MTEQGSRRGLIRSGLGWIINALQQPIPRHDDQPEPIAWSAFDRLQLSTPAGTAVGAAGEHRARVRAPSPDFADYRPYQPGDDYRRIDWNVFGRLGALQVRLSEAHQRVSVRVLLDCSGSMHWGEPNKLQFAGRLATALGRVALARGDSLRVDCLGTDHAGLGPVVGLSGFAALERLLRQPPLGGRVDLSASIRGALDTVSTRSSGRPLIILISDLHHLESSPAVFELLAERCPGAAVLHILSPDEVDPEAIGDVDIQDSETGEILEVGLSVDSVQRYRERFRAWQVSVAKACTGHTLRYVHCATDRAVGELMLADFREQRIVQ